MKTPADSSQMGIDIAETPAQWAEIKNICCETAASGAPIAQERWPFFGDYWVGPYERFLPQWTYVFSRDDRVLGYLTGCPDTRELEWRKNLFFTPTLAARVARGRYVWNADVKRFLKRATHLEKNPNDLFPHEVLDRIAKEFPAHLHINFRPEARGSGCGRELVERFEADLERRGISGYHVFCGPKPVGFYEKVGMTLLGKIEFKKDVWVFAFGKKLKPIVSGVSYFG